MKKIVVMDYNKASVTIRNLTRKELETEVYEGVDSDCEYMVVDKLIMDVSV